MARLATHSSISVIRVGSTYSVAPLFFDGGEIHGKSLTERADTYAPRCTCLMFVVDHSQSFDFPVKIRRITHHRMYTVIHSTVPVPIAPMMNQINYLPGSSNLSKQSSHLRVPSGRRPILRCGHGSGSCGLLIFSIAANIASSCSGNTPASAAGVVTVRKFLRIAIPWNFQIFTTSFVFQPARLATSDASIYIGIIGSGFNGGRLRNFDICSVSYTVSLHACYTARRFQFPGVLLGESGNAIINATRYIRNETCSS